MSKKKTKTSPSTALAQSPSAPLLPGARRPAPASSYPEQSESTPFGLATSTAKSSERKSSRQAPSSPRSSGPNPRCSGPTTSRQATSSPRSRGPASSSAPAGRASSQQRSFLRQNSSSSAPLSSSSSTASPSGYEAESDGIDGPFLENPGTVLFEPASESEDTFIESLVRDGLILPVDLPSRIGDPRSVGAQNGRSTISRTSQPCTDSVTRAGQSQNEFSTQSSTEFAPQNNHSRAQGSAQPCPNPPPRTGRSLHSHSPQSSPCQARQNRNRRGQHLLPRSAARGESP